MANVSVTKQSGNGNNKSLAALSTRSPIVDDFLDKFSSTWPFLRPSLSGIETSELSLNPRVDIVEDNKTYRLSAELPGLDLDDINLDLSDGVLTLSGEKKTEKKEDKEDNYHMMERTYGFFRRSFSLPPSIEEDKIQATFKKGVLDITLPKSAAAQKLQRKISIKE